MYSHALHISNGGGGKECTAFSHFDRGRRLHENESRHSENYEHCVFRLCWTVPFHFKVQSVAHIMLHLCDLSFIENIHSCCSMVSCLSTMQCLITILVFRICCRTGTRGIFHHLLCSRPCTL